MPGKEEAAGFDCRERIGEHLASDTDSANKRKYRRPELDLYGGIEDLTRGVGTGLDGLVIFGSGST